MESRHEFQPSAPIESIQRWGTSTQWTNPFAFRCDSQTSSTDWQYLLSIWTVIWTLKPSTISNECQQCPFVMKKRHRFIETARRWWTDREQRQSEWEWEWERKRQFHVAKFVPIKYLACGLSLHSSSASPFTMELPNALERNANTQHPALTEWCEYTPQSTLCTSHMNLDLARENFMIQVITFCRFFFFSPTNDLFVHKCTRRRDVEIQFQYCLHVTPEYYRKFAHKR